jgi:hypothetical protein
MRICCIADLHGKLPIIPECDLLLVAGDVCPHFLEKYAGDSSDCFGQSKWLQSVFTAWLENAPAKHKVMTFGNHARSKTGRWLGVRW